jgi:serine O-acetyltransferase
VSTDDGYGNPDGIGFWALVREDLRTHDGDWTVPGFRVLFVHRFGNWRMGVRSSLLRAPLSGLYRRMHRKVRNKYGIELDFSTRVGRRVHIQHQSAIVINGYCVIGDECIIRHSVTMGIRSLDDMTAAPTLGRGVDVGAGAVILGRITVGDGAQIGANAVVLRDVPAGAVAVGVPARIIERVGTASGGAT